MQHAQHKENDFLAAGCVRIGREKKKIEEERKEGRKRKKGGKRQPTLREKQREKCNWAKKNRMKMRREAKTENAQTLCKEEKR